MQCFFTGRETEIGKLKLMCTSLENCNNRKYNNILCAQMCQDPQGQKKAKKEERNKSR